MAPRNFGKDKIGKALGPESLIRVRSSTGKYWKGWVVSYDEEKDLLTVCDAKRAYLRSIHPNQCLVIRPTEMDYARKKGQDASISYASEKLQRKRFGI